MFQPYTMYKYYSFTYGIEFANKWLDIWFGFWSNTGDEKYQKFVTFKRVLL